MEEDKIVTYKGIWSEFNKFVNDDTGEVINVAPYTALGRKYEHLIPFPCYMQIIDNGSFLVASNIVVIDPNNLEK